MKCLPKPLALPKSFSAQLVRFLAAALAPLSDCQFQNVFWVSAGGRLERMTRSVAFWFLEVHASFAERTATLSSYYDRQSKTDSSERSLRRNGDRIIAVCVGLDASKRRKWNGNATPSCIGPEPNELLDEPAGFSESQVRCKGQSK